MEQYATLEQLRVMLEEAVSAEKKNSEQIISYFGECAQLGIEVLPLDMNRSKAGCSFEDDKALRLGFSAILSGDESFLEHFFAVRRERGGFQSFRDCCEHLDFDGIPASFFPSCIEAGAFDAIEESRARLFAGYEKILKAVRALKAEQASHQISLFAVLPPSSQTDITVPPLPKIDEWTDEEIVEHEHHAMGFSFTAYLLQQNEPEEAGPEHEILQHATEPEREAQKQEDADVNPAGTETSSLSEAEPTGTPEPPHIPSDIQETGHLSQEESPPPPPDAEVPPFPPEMLSAEEMDAAFPQRESESPPLAQEITGGEAESVAGEDERAVESNLKPQHVVLRCTVQTTTEDMLLQIQKLCSQYPGELEVFLEFTGEDQQTTRIKAHTDYRVSASGDFISSVEDVLGDRTLRLVPTLQ